MSAVKVRPVECAGPGILPLGFPWAVPTRWWATPRIALDAIARFGGEGCY